MIEPNLNESFIVLLDLLLYSRVVNIMFQRNKKKVGVMDDEK